MGLLDTKYSDTKSKELRRRKTSPSQSDVRKYEGLLAERDRKESVMNLPQGLLWQPEYEREPGLEAPMFSPDDLIGTGVGKAVAMPLLAALGVTAIGSKAAGKQGAKQLADALSSQRGAIAWHGSPHKFDKFDLSKIGTGEGAQAYGHGLYLAEAPDVAKAYRSNLVENPSFLERKTGRVISSDSPEYKDLIERQRRMERNGYGAEFDKKYQIQEGALYKTDIPDEALAKFLDWDKPLSQQPEVVNAFRNYVSETQRNPDAAMNMLAGKTGGEAYSTLAGINPHLVSSGLEEYGIPGIRYLDGGSRSAGQGSSNYVVFDPEMIRILERNGEATGLQPWKPGEYGLLGKAPEAPQEQALRTAQINAAKPVSEGGLGLRPDNTPMERAKAMGAAPVYHGTVDDVSQIDPKMFGSSTGSTSAKQAFWTVDDPTVANTYANYAATYAPVQRVMSQADAAEKIAQKTGNWDKYDALLAKAESLEAELADNGLRGQNIMPLMVMKKGPTMDAAGESFHGVEGDINQFLRKSKPHGAATITNLDDAAGRVDLLANHTAVFNPALLRSRFAAFDPARRNEADLLAGVAPYAIPAGLLGLLMANQDPVNYD